MAAFPCLNLTQSQSASENGLSKGWSNKKKMKQNKQRKQGKTTNNKTRHKAGFLL
jgi:hypothetical protein